MFISGVDQSTGESHGLKLSFPSKVSFYLKVYIGTNGSFSCLLCGIKIVMVVTSIRLENEGGETELCMRGREMVDVDP